MLMVTTLTASAVAPAQQREIPIWPGKAPGSESWNWEEVRSTAVYGSSSPIRIVRNVVTPTLIVYPPDPGSASGAAVIIAAGGGSKSQWMVKRQRGSQSG